MRVRKLDENGDYSFGKGAKDFWRDVPDAPAQCARTRLYLFQGEWFLDSTEGTPWETEVLGKYTGSTRDPVIRTRVLGTQGVKEILEYDSQLDRDSREFAVQLTIDTIYGQAVVAGAL